MVNKETIIELLQNQFLSAGLILSTFAGIFLFFKKFGNFLLERIKRKFIYSVTIEETDELFLYFEKWLNHKYPNQYKNMIVSLGKTNNIQNNNEAPIKPNNLNTVNENTDIDTLSYKQFTDLIFVRYKNSIIKINKERQKLDHAKDMHSLYFGSYKLTILFFKWKLNSLIDDVVEYNQQFKPKNINDLIRIFDCSYGDWYSKNSNDGYIKPKGIDNIILNNDIKNDLLNDIQYFLNNKDWYNNRSIPYKRGYLFHGEPGNGKTSLALALAKHIKRNIYLLSLNDLTDRDIKRAISGLPNNAILLIEDIDAVFDGRKSKVKDVTFSNFLQCLDGVLYSEDFIIIITTNHIEKLDKALIRDGRIDMILEINNPSKDLIKNYLELYYEQNLNDFNDREYVNNYSMSKIQNICLQNNDIDSAIEKIFN